MINFLPCPFCGSTRIGCHHGRSGRKSGYQCMCLDCKVKQSSSYHDSPEAAAAVWNARKPLSGSQTRWPPVAFGAHRYGRWGYIWHTEDDVAGWIRTSNQQIPDPNAHWHGPVALFDDIEALADEVELKQACIAGMQDQMSKLASRLEHCQQWYAARFERLGDLARTLPEPTQTQLFNIMANGSADWMETPSYMGMLTMYERQRDEFEKRADNLGAMLGRMTHATRHADDPRIVEVRNAAITLIRKLGASNPLRAP
ncbi:MULTISPECIES: Lar family restriction alleviation protein [Rhodocyclales]|uniref:Lar family restriction alleviation protein n=1 Tax=Azonexus hydrophilus TaxID=418702 RepID=A0ABZ2XNM1_9RHOO|nr:Lar family restriction alleviation protein [Azospira sp. I09]